ncbi:MAG: histidine kinase [Ignavibacteriales bacterium]|nr:histidine kinase [Ignavibacteriales bacterium]
MSINKNITLTVFVVAGFIQLIIISYNHMTGYINIPNFGNFLIRLAIGTSFSFVFALLLVYIDIQIINRLDKILELPEKLLPRIPFEFFLTVLAGIIVGITVTILAGSLMPYEDGLIKHLINNAIITSVINIIMISIIEAISWFKRSQDNLIVAEKLAKENSQIKFETLKSQLNPHFLFNSLNVLSSLIKKDSEKAQDFVDEFSSVYRYTLDVIEKPIVELSDEINFAMSYLFLQKNRFGNAVNVEINVDASKLNYLVPPLAIQTLLENAFKHNKVSEDQPLHIKIYNEENLLFVANNLQPKIKSYESKGVGLVNLKKRYELLGEKSPLSTVTENEYISNIPLINPD